MIIRMLRTGGTLYGHFVANQVINIPKVVARKWCRNGIAKKSRGKPTFLVEEGQQKGRACMRVRILKPVATGYGGFRPGAVATLPDKVARNWCKTGIAMQDKSLDEPKEAKVSPEVPDEAKILKEE